MEYPTSLVGNSFTSRSLAYRKYLRHRGLRFAEVVKLLNEDGYSITESYFRNIMQNRRPWPFGFEERLHRVLKTDYARICKIVRHELPLTTGFDGAILQLVMAAKENKCLPELLRFVVDMVGRRALLSEEMQTEVVFQLMIAALAKMPADDCFAAIQHVRDAMGLLAPGVKN